MCLILFAHRASAELPFVIAANRDEDHARPSLAASWWHDAPDILGGRDALHGGTWLAISRAGRFAAVTNLRGQRTKKRSRGLLVRNFIEEGETPVPSDLRDYAGFHLLAGIAGEELTHYSNAMPQARPIPAGMDGISNADPGVRWPKVDAGVDELRAAIATSDPEVVVERMLAFLATSIPGPREASPFVLGETYGTRSSTVIVGTRDGATSFVEQNWLRSGVRDGVRGSFKL
ncbi:MAG: hypothetical protein JWO56_3418 [Acidobacteria bacterium]|nr:hypothetical protein [Acidobacteriota bacterium]